MAGLIVERTDNVPDQIKLARFILNQPAVREPRCTAWAQYCKKRMFLVVKVKIQCEFWPGSKQQV